MVGVFKSSAYYLASMLFSLSELHWGWGQVGNEKCSLPLPFNNFTGLKQHCLLIHTLKQTCSAVKIKTMLVYSYCPLNPGYIAFTWSLAHSSPPNLQFSYWQYQVGKYSNLILTVWWHLWWWMHKGCHGFRPSALTVTFLLHQPLGSSSQAYLLRMT